MYINIFVYWISSHYKIFQVVQSVMVSSISLQVYARGKAEKARFPQLAIIHSG